MLGLDSYPALAVKSMQVSIEQQQGHAAAARDNSISGSGASSRTSSSGHAIASRTTTRDVTNENSPSIGAAASPTSPPAATASPAQVASSVSDSSEQMFEENVRVLAVCVGELNQLLLQRKKGAAAAQQAEHQHPHPQSPHQPKSHTATLQYAQLTPDQANNLTSHLLLNASLLVQQATHHWTCKTRRRPADESLVSKCHDPSPLPWPKEEWCTCRTGDQSLMASASSALHFSVPVGPPTAASTPPTSSPSTANPTPIRRTVLPFSNIALLEKNILGLRTARGTQLRQQRESSSQPHSLPFDSGVETVHPRDIQLLQGHFAQLLSYQLPPGKGANSHPLLPPSTHNPLSLLHPFGLGLHELATSWIHQTSYVSQATRQGRIVIDRTFLKEQHSCLARFLSSHETLITLAYPYLSVTVLCRRILRSVLRGQVLHHPAISQTLWEWYETCYSEDDSTFAERIDAMRGYTLSEIGVQFPYNLHGGSLLQSDDRIGEGIPGYGRSAIDPSVLSGGGAGVGGAEEDPHDEYAYEEHSLALQGDQAFVSSKPQSHLPLPSEGEPVDRLIHSDGEGEDETDGPVIPQRHVRGPSAAQHHGSSSIADRTSPASRPARRIPRVDTSGVNLKRSPLGGGGGPVASTASSSNALAFLSSSPKIPAGGLVHQFPTSTLSKETSFLNPNAMIGVNSSANVSPAASGSSSLAIPHPRRSSSGGSTGSGDMMLPPSALDARGAVRIGGAGTTAAFQMQQQGSDPDAPPPLPYARSIALLSTLNSSVTVDAKLEILIAACREITRELQEFLHAHGLDEAMSTDNTTVEGSTEDHSTTGSMQGVGGELSSTNSASSLYSITCDDLFQILSFCMLHAGVESPIATSHLLEDWIEGHALAGEGGYVLTTFQCSIQLIREGPGKQPSLGQSASFSQMMQHSRQSSSADMDVPFFAGRSFPSTRDSALSNASVSSNGSGGSIGGSVPPSPAGSSISGLSIPPSPGGLSHSHANKPHADAALFSHQLAANLDAFCIAADYLQLDAAWSWLFDKDNVTVYRKFYPHNSIASIKGTSVIHRPPAVIQGFLKNINSRQAVDDLYIGGRILLHLTADTKLVHYKFKARNWCSRQQTDMCLLLHQGVCNDGVTLVTLAFSVTHPSCPPQPGFSRATVRASGWLFKPVNGGQSSHVTYIVSPDGNGFPTWIVNLVSSKQPMLIRNVREYLYSTTTQETANSSSGTSIAPSSPSISQSSLASSTRRT